jgi:hypothetical protein
MSDITARFGSTGKPLSSPALERASAKGTPLAFANAGTDATVIDGLEDVVGQTVRSLGGLEIVVPIPPD